MARHRLAIALLLLLAPVAGRCADSAETGDTALVVREVLALKLPENSRTHLLPRDPVLAAVVAGTWRAPRAGDRVPLGNGAAAAWTALAADSSGWFHDEALESGWACATVDLPAAGVRLLEAGNHDYVFVNGEPRAGNKYRTKDAYESWEPRHDFSSLPVSLRAGRNVLLFRCERGGLKVELRRPSAPVLLNVRDLTAPDLVVDRKPFDHWAALPVINTTDRPLTGLVLEVVGDGLESDATPLPPIPSLSVRKVGFRIAGEPPDLERAILHPDLPVVLRLRAGNDPAASLLDEAAIALRVIKWDAVRRITFVSGIDGSVQSYAELPAKPGSERIEDAIVLSLHGANVEARNQAASYTPKPWARIVAPTNRRPYGFSWEDWGRLDALEVLDLVMPVEGPGQLLPTVWLTGHSMGGHGAWSLGATCPDRFAAIGPSAGWATFWTYRFEYDRASLSPAERMLSRASNASETLQLAPNLARLGVYALHGGADDNVPPAQSHLFVDALKSFHPDWVYHEEPGQGHWWDLSPEPGVDCVDWAPMFEFFARRARLRDDATLEIDFRTASPGVSARCGWVTILGQERQHELSRVHVRCLPESRRVMAETENVSQLWLAPKPLGPGADMTVELDGQLFPADPQFRTTGPSPGARFELREGRWVRDYHFVRGNDPGATKTPARYGPFKDAFRHRFQFVVGTRGSAEENAWAAAKARFDAETWWYQGNGDVDIVRDVDFDPAAEPDRGVILYGAGAANAAWAKLLPDCPVQVGRGAVRIGGRRLAGHDLACLFVRPRPGSSVACVAVVAGTGPAGRRLTDTLPYLQAGFSLPDCCVLSPRILSDGGLGIRAAGFFGDDWSVGKGEFLWQE
ncbi:MAG: prolyl oligopeptidase family serine peptidase [Candidatus Krumholzibacteriia bacterium]